MVPKTKRITPFLTLKTVCTDKFKTERISVTIETLPHKRITPIEQFAFSVLKRGCESYPTQRALNIRCDELYSASVSPVFLPGGGKHRIGFAAEMLGDGFVDESVFEKTLALLFDVFWNPLLDENGQFIKKYVESERENICDAVRSAKNNPRMYAIKRLIEIMYEGDEYSFSTRGSVDTVNSITVDELIEAYRDLVENSSYEVFYVGAKSSEEVEKAVLKFFEKSGFGKEKIIENKVTFDVDTKKVKRVNETMQLAQGKLVIGFKTGVNITCGNDFYAMVMLNEIYGATAVSKLFLNVRERLGLCYYCTSRYDVHKGFIFVVCEIDPDDRKKAEKEIIKYLKEIKKGRITDTEFESAKKSLLSVYSETMDSAVSIERFYMLREEYGVTDTVDDAKMAIEALTVSDVIRVSKNIELDTVYFLYGENNNDD